MVSNLWRKSAVSLIIALAFESAFLLHPTTGFTVPTSRQVNVLKNNDCRQHRQTKHVYKFTSLADVSAALSSSLSFCKSSPPSSRSSGRLIDSRLHFFFRRQEDEEEKEEQKKENGTDERNISESLKKDEAESEDLKKDTVTTTTSSFGSRVVAPFFARMQQQFKENEEPKTTTGVESSSSSSSLVGNEVETENSTTTIDSTTIVAEAEPAPVPPPKPATAEEQAKRFRADAERARLEADRMEAELTLQKIERLEKKLADAKKKAAATAPDDTKEDNTSTSEKGKQYVLELQREMDILQRKLRGETVAPAPKTTEIKTSTRQSTGTAENFLDSASETKSKRKIYGVYSTLSSMGVLNTDTDIAETVELLEGLPDFLLKPVALVSGLNVTAKGGNKTELAIQLVKISQGDFSFTGKEAPAAFTAQQIEEQQQWMRENPADAKDILKITGGNETEAALRILEFDYYLGAGKSDQDLVAELEELLPEALFETFNASFAQDRVFESLYPKCTRKEGQEPSVNQVETLFRDVLPKTPFTSTAKPMPVLGGFIIRGSSKIDSGDKLIEAIDKEIEKVPSLKNKLTVVYTKDYSVLADMDGMDDVTFDTFIETVEDSFCLYVLGPDIVRERRRVPLSIVSAFGLATSWYLSIYPFLLNPAIAKRIDEELALADVGMVPDLTWLTDLSIPLFAAFFGLQIVHEIGHGLAGNLRGIRTTFPTFVPSLITGITSAVTTFKNPPKNKEALFDFAIAGPLLGILASIGAIVIGAGLTATVQDPSLLPALPLEILRQSTLGGGIIDGVLGGGALSVPDGALGTAAVSSMTVPLHPIAIAGFISLIVNALNVLPIGTTDGGRIALALFGREVKIAIGNLFFFALLLVGSLGSDLFLFYFAFLLAFQAGNEVPARNEVDTVDFSRVILATVTYVLALSALIPFQ